MAYSIGEVAKMLNVSKESLRNWEKHGLIPQPQRRPTSGRQYTTEDIKAIKEYLVNKYK